MANHTPPPAEALAYNVNATSAMLGVGRTTVYKLIEQGELRPIKVGGRTCFTRTELQRFLDAQEQTQGGAQ